MDKFMNTRESEYKELLDNKTISLKFAHCLLVRCIIQEVSLPWLNKRHEAGEYSVRLFNTRALVHSHGCRRTQ